MSVDVSSEVESLSSVLSCSLPKDSKKGGYSELLFGATVKTGSQTLSLTGVNSKILAGSHAAKSEPTPVLHLSPGATPT